MASPAQSMSPSGGVIEDNKNNKIYNFYVANYPFLFTLAHYSHFKIHVKQITVEA